MEYFTSALTVLKSKFSSLPSILSSLTIESFFGLDVLQKVNVFNLVYALWLIRFLYWTHTSSLYYIFALASYAVAIYFPAYYSYIWYFFLLQVLMTLWQTMLDQYYVKRLIDFEGLECDGTEVTATHLQPKKMLFKEKEYTGKGDFMKLAGIVLRASGWKDATTERKKQLAYAFCHQHLLSHSKIGDESGFTGENASFSLFNPFSPVFIPSSVKNYWFREGIEVKGWTCYKRVSEKGYVTFFRAYHHILFNAKGEITSWEVVRFF